MFLDSIYSDKLISSIIFVCTFRLAVDDEKLDVESVKLPSERGLQLDDEKSGEDKVETSTCKDKKSTSDSEHSYTSLPSLESEPEDTCTPFKYDKVRTKRRLACNIVFNCCNHRIISYQIFHNLIILVQQYLTLQNQFLRFTCKH